MYSLGIDPYTIYLLTYEGIQSDVRIEYWDSKSSSMKSEILAKILLNDINFYKTYNLK